MKMMTDKERQAYEWARSQRFQSVAARNARTLAKFIERMNEQMELALIYIEDGAPKTAADRLRAAITEDEEAA